MNKDAVDVGGIVYHILEGEFSRAKTEIPVIKEKPDPQRYEYVGEKVNTNYRLHVYRRDR